MKNNRIINFDAEFGKIEQECIDLSVKLKDDSKLSQENSVEIENIKKQANELIEKCSIPVEKLSENKLCIDWEALDKSISVDFETMRENADKSSKKDVNKFPAMSKQDYIVCTVIGFAATLIDIFLVGTPKRIKLLGGKEVVKGSALTEMFRKLGQNENSILHKFYTFLEDICKVPYDVVDMKNGIMPKNHRLKSPGHDPLYGLIFAIFDFVCGTGTMINNGVIKIYQVGSQSISKRLLMVFYYLGHLISDILTPMGLPIPGGFLTQILEFDINDTTLAKTFEKMYINGYDLRHFVSMTSSVAFQKLALNLYLSHNKTQIECNDIKAITEAERIQEKAKKQKMIFIISSVATTGNAVKILIGGTTPEAINLPQWIDIVMQSIKMIQVATRDMTYERLAINRKTIDETWQELLEI